MSSYKFLELYYSRYLRPVRDYLVGSLETIMPLLIRMPGLYNALVSTGPGQMGLRAVGLAATPRLSQIDLRRELQTRNIAYATPAALQALSAEERARSVGFLGPFKHAAARNAAMLNELAATGVELVGLDPSMTLTYRAEYTSVLDRRYLPIVMLIQEWLAKHLDAFPAVVPGVDFLLLPHCTERTTAPSSLRDWQSIFAQCGSHLHILPSGCCGMSGTYGHEEEHRETSVRIYRLSWAKYIADAANAGRLLVTGYSCRSQVKLVDHAELPHPLQVLLRTLRRQDGVVH